MNTVWKFKIPTADIFQISLPIGAVPLSVQVQLGEVVLWCFCNSENDTETRRFRLAGTGHPIKEDVNYIGTFQLASGNLVFHLFEIR